jgi:hypothetical protein
MSFYVHILNGALKLGIMDNAAVSINRTLNLG